MKKRVIAAALILALAVSAFCLAPAAQAADTDKTETSAGALKSASDFSWDNASVYFLLTDRFNNGKSSNDHAYNRNLNQSGQPAYGRSDAGAFHGGDFVGITKKIEEGYFDNLGVNALWISAPYEQIHGYCMAASGKSRSFPHYSYHGYYALDFSQTDQAFGTEEEFEAMVDTAHKHGIRIVLDVVMNHVGYNTIGDMNEYGFGKLSNGWQERYYDHTIDDLVYHNYIDYNDSSWTKWWGPQWIRAGLGGGYNQGSGDDLTKNLAYLPDVKTENQATVDIPEILKTKWNKEGVFSKKQSELNNYFSKNNKSKTVRNYLVFWLTQWVEKYGVDGFRCDTAKHVELDSWKALKEQGLKSLKTWRANNPSKPGADWDEDFWMTGECFPHGVSYDSFYTQGGFDSMINFSFCGSGTFDASSGGVPGSGSINNTYADYAKQLNSNDKFNVLSYISSHDTALCRQGDKNIYQGSAFQLLPGAIQIYYGDETNRPLINTFEDHNLRSDMNWSSYDKNVLAHWQKVGKFRSRHVAVGAGSHTNLTATSGTAFARSYNKNGVTDKIAACIAAASNSNVTITLGSIFPDGTEVKNAYDGKTATVSGGKVSFNSGANGTILVEASGDEPQPVTQQPTTVTPETKSQPTNPSVSGKYGDVNGDGNISVKDATAIQKHVANLEKIAAEREALADVNGDTFINIKDATAIQKYIAQLQHNSKTGEDYYSSQPATAAPVTTPSSSQVETPTEAPTEAQQDEDGIRVYFDNSENWDTPYIYFWEGSSGPNAWPGVPMETSSDGRWTYLIPTQYNKVIFNNNQGAQTGDLDVPSSSGMTFSYSNNSWS